MAANWRLKFGRTLTYFFGIVHLLYLWFQSCKWYFCMLRYIYVFVTISTKGEKIYDILVECLLLVSNDVNSILVYFSLNWVSTWLVVCRTYRNKDCCANQKSCTEILFKGQLVPSYLMLPWDMFLGFNCFVISPVICNPTSVWNTLS